MNNPNITASVNIGVGEGKTHTQKTLSHALAGMDDALLKVAEANKGGIAETDRRWRELRGVERKERSQGTRGL